MKSSVSKITDSELEVMRVLWEAGRGLPLSEIRARLEQSSGWESSTIKTLLRRLCDKGAAEATQRDVYYYEPLVSEDEYNEFATRHFIDRLYKGSAKSLVATLLGSKKLNDADLEELRQMFKLGDRDE